MGTGSFLGVKSSWDVMLTPRPLLVLWSWKGRAIPLLSLWAVRPVRSLSAWTRVHFTLYRWWNCPNELLHQRNLCTRHEAEKKSSNFKYYALLQSFIGNIRETSLLVTHIAFGTPPVLFGAESCPLSATLCILLPYNLQKTISSEECIHRCYLKTSGFHLTSISQPPI